MRWLKKIIELLLCSGAIWLSWAILDTGMRVCLSPVWYRHLMQSMNTFFSILYAGIILLGTASEILFPFEPQRKEIGR